MPVNINNCKIKFRCRQSWDSLIGTDRADIKYCSECDRGVHYCTGEAELIEAEKNDWCVALDVEIKDRHIIPMLGDITYQAFEEIAPQATALNDSDIIDLLVEFKNRSKKD